MKTSSIFSSRFGLLLDEFGLTHAQLGESIGRSKGSVGHWRTGIRQPNIDDLVAIADYFDVSVDYLLGRTDDPTPPEKPAG